MARCSRVAPATASSRARDWLARACSWRRRAKPSPVATSVARRNRAPMSCLVRLYSCWASTRLASARRDGRLALRDFLLADARENIGEIGLGGGFGGARLLELGDKLGVVDDEQKLARCRHCRLDRRDVRGPVRRRARQCRSASRPPLLARPAAGSGTDTRAKGRRSAATITNSTIAVAPQAADMRIGAGAGASAG